MTGHSRRRRAARGFTLLEVLISITLLALIAGICYAAFHLGTRAVQKGTMAVVTAQRLRVATDVLIHQVKSAVVTPAMDSEGNTYPYFYGQPNSMSFVTEAGQLGGGGRSRVTYSITQDPPQLVLEETIYFDAQTLGGKPEPDQARSAILLDGFRSGHFEFYDEPDSVGCPGRWCSSWDPGEDVIPNAVRIVIEGLFGLDEDVWQQAIPIMSVTSTYNDAATELGDDDELQDCEDVNVAAPTSGGTGTSPGGGRSAGPNADDEGDDE